MSVARTAMYKVFVSDQKRGGKFACLRIHLLWTFICLTRFSMYPYHPCMVCRYGSTGLNAILCLRRHALKPSGCSNSAAPSLCTAFGWLPQRAASSSSFCHGSSRVLVLITARDLTRHPGPLVRMPRRSVRVSLAP